MIKNDNYNNNGSNNGISIEVINFKKIETTWHEYR